MCARSTIADETIASRIYLARKQKVMLDTDLAVLYGIETKQFNQAVKRNVERFPRDFMFRLTAKEFENLRSQFVTSSHGGRRHLPYAFTEQGVAMLSSILKSEVAVKVNIRIIRIFTRMRALLLSNKDILLKLEKLERKVSSNTDNIQLVFEHLRQLLNPPEQTRRRIGFKSDD